MKRYLNRLPKEIQRLIHLAASVGRDNNQPVYLVGGFVRDLILGVDNLDVDIVVEGDGIRFAQDFAGRLNNKRLISHKRFLTAVVISNHKLKIDIATARKEIYPHPGSLPLVTPAALKDDLARRDFTINASAISICKKDFGRFIDFFSSRADILRKKIRILHNLSFLDDPTRLLRAIRFEQRYNFDIEPHTLRLLKQAVLLNALEKVGPHRLRDEIILILKEPHPIRYIRRINNLIGLSFLNGQIRYSKQKVNLLRSIENEIRWFENKTPSRRRVEAWLMYLTGLLGDLSSKQIKEFGQRFALCKGEISRILSYKNTVKATIKKLKKKTTPSRVYRCLEPLSFEVILLIKAACKDETLQDNISNFFNIYNGARIYTTGYDLAGLSIKPGPQYKDALTRTLYAKLNGKIASKKEELLFINRLIKQS